MELKLLRLFHTRNLIQLLIVPYGIETRKSDNFPLCIKLLIVPYGIETVAKDFVRFFLVLLIVPYGIETP